MGHAARTNFYLISISPAPVAKVSFDNFPTHFVSSDIISLYLLVASSWYDYKISWETRISPVILVSTNAAYSASLLSSNRCCGSKRPLFCGSLGLSPPVPLNMSVTTFSHFDDDTLQLTSFTRLGMTAWDLTRYNKACSAVGPAELSLSLHFWNPYRHCENLVMVAIPRWRNELLKLENEIRCRLASRIATNSYVLVATKEHISVFLLLLRLTWQLYVLEFEGNDAPWTTCCVPLPERIFQLTEGTFSYATAAFVLLSRPPIQFWARSQGKLRWLFRIPSDGWKAVDNDGLLLPSCTKVPAYCASFHECIVDLVVQ